VAVASFQPTAVVYREEQNFDRWVYLFIALIEALVGVTLLWLYKRGHDPVADGGLAALVVPLFAAAGICLPVLFALGFLRMTTEVDLSEIRVWFGWIPTYRRVIAIPSVKSIEAVTYRALADYGGWGIRQGRDGERVLTARGNRGVRLELTDGSRFLIGSQNPEALARAIESALRPGG
jgi:hypothetical protein